MAIRSTDKAENGVTFKEFVEDYERETGNDLHSDSTARTVAEVLWDRYCEAQLQIKEGSGE